MATTQNFLRRIAPDRFQVHIGDRVAAVLRLVGDTTIEIWTLADRPVLLITLIDEMRLATNPVHVARRIAEGEFDNDFRYEIAENPEPDQPSNLYSVTRIAIPSQQVLESFTTDDPYRDVEAAREVQAIPDSEERWALYAGRGW